MWFSQNVMIKQSAQEADSPKKANYTQLNK